jgi:hypothetical protein
VLSFAGVAKTFIITATRRLKMLNDGKGKDVPSEETVLDSIRFMDPNILFDDLRKANDCILKNAVTNNEFNYNIVVVALDIHNVMKYTKVSVDNSKRKRKSPDI